MGACADVEGGGDLGVGCGGLEGGEGRVVEVPEGGARRALGAEVGLGEEGGGVDLEADAEEGVDLEAHPVAEVVEGADLAFTMGYGGRDGLLGFAVGKFGKVESPV